MNKKYKLIVFDIDGTLTNEPNPWLTIHYYLSTWTHLTQKYKQLFLDGEITYKEFCKLEVAHWRRTNVNEIQNLFNNLKTPKNSFKALKIFKESGFRLVAISTGIQFVSEKLKLKDYFDDIFYNEIEVKNGILTGHVKINVDNKLKLLDKYLKEHNLKYEETIIIGDGDNDVEIAKKVGYSIAFCPNSSKMSEIADLIIDEFDYSKIIEKIKGF